MPPVFFTFSKSIKFFCVLLLILSLFGCQSHQEKKIRIGVSQCSVDDWRNKMNEEIEREVLFNENVEVEIRSANGDNTTQIKDIKNFIAENVDILIVSPNESTALTPVIEEVYSKGIPVITVDRDIESDSYTTHIEVDNEAIGEEAALYASAKFSNSPAGVKAIELQGNREMTPSVKRHEGFRRGLADSSDATLLASIDCGWNGEIASVAADSLLKIYPETNFIFAHNDNMALKVAARLADMGRRDILVLGVDGIPQEGIKAVADGTIDATLLYPTEGGYIVKKALEILRGGNVVKTDLLSPTGAIEKNEATVLLGMDRVMQEETREIMLLRGKVSEYFDRYTLQKWLFYCTLTILAVLFSLMFVVFRHTWRKIRADRNLRLETILTEEATDEKATAEKSEETKEAPAAHPMEKAEKSEFYRKFITIIHNNIKNPNLNIDDMASEMGLSKSQLGRRIKSLTGFPPVEIIRNERLKMAKVMLTSSEDKTVSEIAYEVGFSLPSYFSKCYRDFYGESPSEVRKRVFG